jgi:gamma-glutamyltranspeptidase/glutathione hydrolase
MTHRRGAAIWASIFALVIGEAIVAPAGAKSPQPKTYFIAAANPYAVEAGARILESGGSAVDAAIATQAVLGLVEPQSSGLGGGAFLLHYDPATKKLETYDGRETAPASARPDRFIAANGKPMNFMEAVNGGLSVGVPGAVKMLALAHQEHGKTPWAELWSPAYSLATDGFKVSPRLHRLIAENVQMKKTPAARAYFYDAAGAPIAVGTVLKNPQYAEILRRVAVDGPDGFYKGAVAEAIVKAVNEAPNPGGMTLDDLANYAPVKREAVCGRYRALKLCSMAPPSSGGVTLLEMLAMLEPFDLRKAAPMDADALHLIFEAGKLAYADRNQYLSDKDRSGAAGGLTQDEVIRGLLNPAYLADRAKRIDRARAAENVRAGDPGAFETDPAVAAKWRALNADVSADLPSTSHFVIVDGEGRVVSMTTTVEFTFGSQQMAMGMVLNNQLTDFSFLPEVNGVPVANAVAPGKRPRSSMTPVIIFDKKGRVWGALGSPGGPAIMGYVAKTVIGLLDWNLSMQEAIDLPNAVIPRGAPALERGRFDPATIESLKQRGHAVSERDLNSGLHGFRALKNGAFDGGADKRREGTVKTGRVTQTP